MSTIHLHQTTTSDARAVRRRAHRLRAWPLEALWQQRRRVPQGASVGAARRPTSRKARAASGNACTTTGPIPTTSSSRRPTPTRGEARRATPTPSRVGPTARPTLTWSSYATARTSRDGCSASWSGPSARAFWKRRLKTPSRPSKPGTARRERKAQHERIHPPFGAGGPGNQP